VGMYELLQNISFQIPPSYDLIVRLRFSLLVNEDEDKTQDE